MHSAAINLLLYYVGFGYVLLLCWAIVLSDAVKSTPPAWTRTAATVLLVVGVAHPAAAVAAWDLRRELARDHSDPNAKASSSLVVVIVSLVIAAAVIIVTSQT